MLKVALNWTLGNWLYFQFYGAKGLTMFSGRSNILDE